MRDGDDPALRTVVDDALRYIYEDALRTPEGGLNHLGVVDLVGVSMWIDTLFMVGNVLTGWGEVHRDARALDEFTEQLGIFTTALQGDLGFYKHAARSAFPQDDDVYWGRGNGWVLAATFDHLRVRRVRGEDLPPDTLSAALRLVDAVIEWQNTESGLWWTVVNRPGASYLETSASALFAFGLARGYRYGFLDDSVLPTIEAAMRGVRSRITGADAGEPVVTGVSGPTSVGDFAYYASVPVEDDLPYGIGAVLLALTEVSGLPRSPRSPRTPRTQ